MAVHITLLVLYTPRLEECRAFYAGLGLTFAPERHGQGPDHYAAVLTDGTVLELYPESATRRTDHLRLGLTLTDTPLAPGRHRLTDPDGRVLDVLAG